MRLHHIVMVAALLAGCVSATFHSKTGRTYPALTARAVIVDPNEVRGVLAAGGEVIGTISTDGTTNKSHVDLADKAAKLAAERGGTHVVMTDTGTIDTTTTHPATTTEQCSGDGDDYQCTTVATPETTSTMSRPTAEFQVIRVAPEAWNRLPPALRPAI